MFTADLKKLTFFIVLLLLLALSGCSGGLNIDDSVSNPEIESPSSPDTPGTGAAIGSQFLSIIDQPDTQTLSSAESLTLSLQVSASGDYMVNWYKDGSVIGQTEQYRNETLTVADSGTYSCEVNSRTLTEQCSSFEIVVQDPPLIDQSPGSQTLTEGGNLSLAVAARGTDIEYQWYFNGMALADETAERLSINGIVAAQAGHYHCTVSNAVGRVSSATATVSVLPTVEFGTVQVSWERPGTRSDGSNLAINHIRSYRVYYGPTHDSEYTNAVEVAAADLSVVLENLELGEYRFAVSTIDTLGQESRLSAEVLLSVN